MGESQAIVHSRGHDGLPLESRLQKRIRVFDQPLAGHRVNQFREGLFSSVGFHRRAHQGSVRKTCNPRFAPPKGSNASDLSRCSGRAIQYARTARTLIDFLPLFDLNGLGRGKSNTTSRADAIHNRYDDHKIPLPQTLAQRHNLRRKIFHQITDGFLNGVRTLTRGQRVLLRLRIVEFLQLDQLI